MTLSIKSIVSVSLSVVPFLRRQIVLYRKVRSKIRPKNGFFCYAPFLGLIFWVTFCSNSNTLTFDSKVYIWNNLTGEKIIVTVIDFELKKVLLPPPPSGILQTYPILIKFQAASFKRCLHSVLQGVSL